MLVSEMCNRVLDFRDANPDAVFHDMAYEQLVRDPVGAVREMYGTFGRELSPEAEQAMRLEVDDAAARACTARTRTGSPTSGSSETRSRSGSRATTTVSTSLRGSMRSEA